MYCMCAYYMYVYSGSTWVVHMHACKNAHYNACIATLLVILLCTYGKNFGARNSLADWYPKQETTLVN